MLAALLARFWAIGLAHDDPCSCIMKSVAAIHSRTLAIRAWACRVRVFDCGPSARPGSSCV
eukprot:15442000-Alexandrium_andersonii.AAC.1